MNESSKSNFKCNHCDYTSEYRHNVYRHIRGKHPDVFDKGEVNEFVSSLPTSPVAVSSSPRPPPPPPPPSLQEEEEDPIDLDKLLDDKLAKFLGDNKVAISPAVRQSAMKKVMSSQGATLIAGMIIGYILTNNLPMILSIFGKYAKNGSSPPRQVGVQLTQEQMMQQVMMRQQQVNRSQQSNESLNQANQSVPAPTMSPLPSSSTL